ncbi:MAG: response regulator transcription factor, partial [Desulfatirhabdiaceae bacterium]
MNRISILVVDDHPIVREGLRALFELEKDIQLVGDVSSGMECLEFIQKVCPDVILMDVVMPGIGGLATTRLVKQAHPQVKVILLTNYEDEEYLMEALRLGADGYA